MDRGDCRVCHRCQDRAGVDLRAVGVGIGFHQRAKRHQPAAARADQVGLALFRSVAFPFIKAGRRQQRPAVAHGGAEGGLFSRRFRASIDQQRQVASGLSPSRGSAPSAPAWSGGPADLTRGRAAGRRSPASPVGSAQYCSAAEMCHGSITAKAAASSSEVAVRAKRPHMAQNRHRTGNRQGVKLATSVFAALADRHAEQQQIDTRSLGRTGARRPRCFWSARACAVQGLFRLSGRPGGKGETLEAAARRELFEETGLAAGDLQQVETIETEREPGQSSVSPARFLHGPYAGGEASCRRRCR
jgi:hypothetical protein